MMPFHKKEKNIIWEKIGIQCVSQTYKKDRYGSKHHKFRAIKPLR